MHYSKSRMPASFSNDRKYDSSVGWVRQSAEKDVDKLSPVDLSITAATTIQLPPLAWHNYHLTPACMTVRNSGFTVMINAIYDNEVPYVNSGPLAGNYVFSQVHFHWGEHNGTGSGHASDGMRYPLEMHVVHLKRDCASLSEALETKDGIAVMVHLFALRAERNTKLDQLTAIMQFILEPRCCARLYPTPLSEIVNPFTSDYFMYWGAVGSPKGRYRILWIISRDVLPVSTQQVEEFRQLKDPQGNLLMANSSKPHKLDGRALFLVCPTQINQTMHGICPHPAQSSEEEDTLEIGNAEYKSLAALEETCKDQCRVCPLQGTKRAANINDGRPTRVNEEDTSVEESCVDLSYDSDDRFTVTTETKLKESSKNQKFITNVNVTAFRPNRMANRMPTEQVYQVISARGSELHIRRKPVVVRQTDPSTEQACMYLDNRSPTRTTFSAPSFSAIGNPVVLTQEYTNLGDLPNTKPSSIEVAVHTQYNGYDSGKDKPTTSRPTGVNYYSNEYEDESFFKESKQTKRLITQGIKESDAHRQPKYIDNRNRREEGKPAAGNPIMPSPQCGQNNLRPKDYNDYYMTEEGGEYALLDKTQRKYLLVKQMKGNTPHYKVVGELPVAYDKNKELPTACHRKQQPVIEKEFVVKNENKSVTRNRDVFGGSRSEEHMGEEMHYESEDVQKSREIHIEESYKNAGNYNPSVPYQVHEPEDNVETEPSPVKLETNQKKARVNQENKSDHYKVSLLVRTTISDHRNAGKKIRGKGQKYFVTKISPVESTKQGNSKDIYYAQPLIDDTQENDNQNLVEPLQNKNTQQRTNENYNKNYLEESYEHTEESHSNVKTICDEKHNNIPEQNPLPKSQPQKHNEDPNIVQNVVYDEELIESEKTDYQRQHHTQRILTTKTPQNSQKNVDNSNVVTNPVIENTTENNVAVFGQEKQNDLTQKVVVYHDQNETDKNVCVVNKTVTGKMGRSNSTDVLVQSKHIETNSPDKAKVERLVDYSLIKNKLPEPKYYVKEIADRSQPIIIRQNLSLNQQIDGKSQVSHTVEYHGNKGKKETDAEPTEHPARDGQRQQSVGLTRFGVTETYEQSSQEQSSSAQQYLQHSVNRFPKLTQQNFQPTNENQILNLSQNSQIYHLKNEANVQDIHKEKKDVLNISVIDPKPVLPNAYMNLNIKNSTEVKRLKGYSDSKLSSTYQQPVNNNTQLYDFQRPIKNNDRINQGGSRYEYEESSFVDRQREQSSREKKIIYRKSQDPNYLDKPPLPSLPPPQTQKELIDRKPSPLKPQLPEQKEIQPTPKDRGLLVTHPSNSGVEYEEIFEENEIVTSEIKKEKTRMVQVKGETAYRFPNQRQKENKPSSQNVISIKKVEIPEPHYITRVPKQPLVEYEAFPVDPQQPFEIVIETYGETSTTVKTNKTFMMFKKINGKAVLNQPSVIEPMKIANGRDTSESFIKLKGSRLVPSKDNGKIVNKENPQQIQPSSNTNKENISNNNLGKDEKESYSKRQQNLTQSVGAISENQIIKPKETKIETNKPQQKLEDPGQNIIKLENLPQPFNIPGNVNQYDYSETNLESEQTFAKKEKKYKYISRQPVHEGTSGAGASSGSENQEEQKCPIPKPEETKIDMNKPQQKQADPGQNVTKLEVVTQPITIPSNIPRNVVQYDYSETNLETEQTFANKEKKYKYISRQPAHEEDRSQTLPPEQKQLLQPGSDNQNITGSKYQERSDPSIWDRPENKKTKIVIGSYRQRIPSAENAGLIGVTKPNQPDVLPDTQQPGKTSHEEYYESSTIDQKHESKKRYVAVRATILDGNTLQPGPLNQNLFQDLKLPVPELEQNKYPDIWDEPTKDLPKSEEQRRASILRDQNSVNRDPYNKEKKKSVTYRFDNEESGPPSAGEHNNENINQPVTNSSLPYTERDGDILIYIRQPISQKKHYAPKITVDVADSHSMTTASLEAQRVQVHEVPPKRTTAVGSAIIPRKSKSEEYPKTFESDIIDIGPKKDDLQDERVIDTTLYNNTLKSQTDVKPPIGQNVPVKPKNEIPITPLSQDDNQKPGPNINQGSGKDKGLAESVSCSSGEDSACTSSMSEKVVLAGPRPGSGSVNQSPIKINTKTSLVRKQPKLEFFRQWDAKGDAILENNGRTLRASYVDNSRLPYLQGGPVDGDYIFSELHFHWGHKDCCGAEHIIDGKKNAVEAHFLYFKKDYKSVKEAMKHSDGIVIVAVNLTVGGPPNPLLGELIRDISLLRESGTGTYVPARYIFAWIKPTVDATKGYYTYKGSLTIDRTESVTWIIFPESIIFCCQQSCEFRKLKSNKGELLKKNYRPPQPLNNRPVYYVPNADDL